MLEKQIDEVLFSAEMIREKVIELAGRIQRDYEQVDQIIMIGVLKGASVFLSDLIREMHKPVQIDFMAVSSYGASTESTGVVRILKDLEMDIENRHVIVVEDIVDTGLTLQYITDNLKRRNAASIKICTLLDKPSRRKCDLHADYVGYEIPDRFIVGYGIDFAEQYRNLPYIATIRENKIDEGE